MRAADLDILVMPGLGDSGPDHWQSRWQARLSTARRLAPGSFDAPVRADWVEAIEREAARATRPVVALAHSLGVVALLHAAKAHSAIAGAFLVAPPSEAAVRELAAVDPAFLPFPRNALPFPALLVASADDPYADMAFSRGLADALGCALVDAGASGHINVASGHGPWPEGSIRFAAFLAGL